MPPRPLRTKTSPNAKPLSHLALPVRSLLTALLLLAACSPATPSAPLESEVDEADAPAQAAGLPATVTHVVDGDTIEVQIGAQTETVRLLGIDTPEKAGGPRPAECFGAEATDLAEQLLPYGTTVLLSRDVETRDQYGRLLAYVHRADDLLFINHEMVVTGHATALFFRPNDRLEPLFNQAADSARRSWIGFWDACGAADVTLPPDP